MQSGTYFVKWKENNAQLSIFLDCWYSAHMMHCFVEPPVSFLQLLLQVFQAILISFTHHDCELFAFFSKKAQILSGFIDCVCKHPSSALATASGLYFDLDLGLF